MPEDPTEEMIKREIAAARAILRDDSVLKSHRELSTRLDKHFPPEPSPDNPPDSDPGKPPSPPRKDPPPVLKQRGGLWWGEFHDS